MKRPDEFASELKEIDKLIADLTVNFNQSEMKSNWDSEKWLFYAKALQDLRETLTVREPEGALQFDPHVIAMSMNYDGISGETLSRKIADLAKCLEGRIPGHEGFLYKWFGYRKPWTQCWAKLYVITLC